MLYWHFREVKLKTDYNEKQVPILLIGNHFSWWDGFIANYINNLLFKRKFHVMMLEEQLKSRMFLNKAGAYSIRKNTRDVVNTLNYTSDLLKNKENLVTIYPQGRIQSLYHYPLEFEKGITSILDKLNNEVKIIFLVSLVDFFSHKKPTLTLGLEEYSKKAYNSAQAMQDAYNDFMLRMINQQKEDRV
jgi:1-acyl-sn-glycerol-3-phosphate acyltransferase